ncbi:MAG: Cupin domain protein [Firmicutes bacterium ADurb.Bin300]|jgi:quercetin dioxygenase-like cupin family protein/DNA-binding XRE family transcriptional regulator|nr:MAG: Cupin domain protein [Firmicutes bacterium ADurb.Bin300]HOD02289.1 cupin domain-containing protein [Clostridiales bacterium]
MNPQLAEIGMRLLTLREICGISSQDMAQRLDMNVDDYLMYEKGEADFSFSFLYNAAKILGVDILDIMSGDSPKLSTCTVVKRGKGYAVKEDSQYGYTHLAYTFRNKKGEPFLVCVEPSNKIPVMHEHDGQEFNYILSGQIKFFIGDISYILSEGDSVYFDSSVPHAEQAIGNKKAEFIAVVMK